MEERNKNINVDEEEYRSVPRNKLVAICRRYERELVQAKDWMFWFLMLWTLVLMFMIWNEFIFNIATPHAIKAGYIVLLGAYIAHKEILRWAGTAFRVRRGEIFVYIWWGTLLLMFIVSYTSSRLYIPDSLTALSYEVLAYFLLTEFSKAINAWQTKKTNRIK